MRKVRLLIIQIVFFLFATSAFAQKQANILDWKTDVSLNTYLVQQMKAQYAARTAEFNKALANQTNTLAYIKSVRQKFKTVVGELPHKSTLDATTTGVIQKDGYRIEKIVYQSFANHRVTANLYLPKGKGKFPSVLLFCGHEDLSKATLSYQQTAILFAKNGFVVFVIDPISQSERVQLTDSSGKSLTRGSTTEHTLLNLSSNLLGTSAAAYELFDNIRGLDYLVSRPEVDTTKIGCIGNSGGAMQSIYFAAFDDRVKIIAPCSYLASREKTFETTGAADGCAQIPNEGLAQLEMSDYLVAAAPKPILVLAGKYDFIDYNGTLQSYSDLKKVYKSLNSSQKLSLFTFDDGHGISKPKREAAVQWFRKWFYNDDRPITEKAAETLTAAELFATSTGKVNTTYPDEINITQKNELLYLQKEQSRKQFAEQSIGYRKQKIESLLGLNPNAEQLEIEDINSGNIGNDINYQWLVLRKRTEVPLPLRIYRKSSSSKQVIIAINDNVKQRDSLISQWQTSKSDAILISVDVRGTGETTDKPEMNDPKYFSKDYRNAMLALHIGKPLVGQRVTDILNVVAFIKGDKNLQNLPITINATCLVAIPALHAMFLNSEINNIHFDQGITSYQSILNHPLEKDRYGAVIANVLSYYDLPDLINWIGKDRVKPVAKF
jgi:dienelactone hydrolase